MKRWMLALLVSVLLLCAVPLAFAADDDPHEHSFGDWYTVTDATCTAAGEERRDCDCDNCDYFETRTIPAAHTFGEWYITMENGCVTDGEEQRDCEACGESETRVLRAHGHSFVIDPEVPATCTTAGKTQGEHCKFCNVVVWPGQTELKPLGHFLDENGDCKVCGEHIKDFCPYCHGDHGARLFGGLTAWFHNLLYRLQQFFRK